MASRGSLKRRQLPKLMACMTKTSLENLRNKALFSMDMLDAKGIRRRRLPLHECIILELREAGYMESSNYVQDLIYDNMQLVADDDIGLVVDLRNRSDYLEHLCNGLQKAEKYKDRENAKKECLELLKLALFFANREKGILWLAEKLFLASIAVASQFLIDGGRQKAVCKYHYAKFLLDKFPGADPEEPFVILTEVRDSAIGRDWPLYEPEKEGDEVPSVTVFCATALELHNVLLSKAKAARKLDPGKAERLSRLAERRANDAGESAKTAEAVIEIGVCQLAMNNLNNAQKTFERAFKMHTKTNNVEGLCKTRMHLAAVMQRLGDHETAAKLLTEMGALAMEQNFRRLLGQALHLLGELHLRRERPDLGTPHLAEAFACFIGYKFSKPEASDYPLVGPDGDLNELYAKGTPKETFEEEAEQSRLMTAISAGQELMPSYFRLLREAGACSVAKIKTIEWKLSGSGWWVKKRQHDFLPCPCPAHKRTPLDVLRMQLDTKTSSIIMGDGSEFKPYLGRQDTVEDMRRLRSDFRENQPADQGPS